ncbi:MAG TPA: aminotransferase class I/II-fold pyridoxal phosphate-dependent enzyme [Bacteroidia bacterium]|nr:aminotransferase class I/II-fold pyridoxal phosphate-dependent enzyme [Bacteroidia bacterium]
MEKNRKDLSHILNHLGEDREEYYGAVSPPIFQTANFASPSVGALREKLKTEMESPFYTRGFNPTAGVLRKKIAALEGAEDAIVFASGSAAVAGAIMSIVKSGDHVICVAKPYSWTFTFLSKYLKKYGVETSFVEGGEWEAFKSVLQNNTRLIYLESPNSLTFELQDISAIVGFAKANGVATILDNSYNSPLNQSGIEMGVDLVLHSATKYLNGHSDVIAGVVCGSRIRIQKMLAEEYMTLGAVVSPHDAWLMLRGLRTLELRVNKSAENTRQIVAFLEKHPRIEKIYYPFSAENPQLALAKKQMTQGGGLFSIKLKAKNVEEVERFCDSLKRFLIATSWGGYESLAFPLCALAASKSFENPLPWNMVRFYVGIENGDHLLEDISQALEKI